METEVVLWATVCVYESRFSIHFSLSRPIQSFQHLPVQADMAFNWGGVYAALLYFVFPHSDKMTKLHNLQLQTKEILVPLI